MKKDVLIIGGGPGGMAVMDELFNLGVTDILLCERSEKLGGLLPQCIHDGFGLFELGRNITGPEYSSVYTSKLHDHYMNILREATVMEICENNEEPEYPLSAKIATAERELWINFKYIVLATGCRERSRGAVLIPGTRPAGVYTAGTAQHLINLSNLVIGKSAVIIGSGDIGLIMARRLTLEGIEVKCVCEIDSVPGGLPRNVRQCLVDFDIPLYLGTTVTNIYGSERVTGVSLSNGLELECDTVILSVGLIPENTLIDDLDLESLNEKSKSSIFICGNALFVHGLVDDVSNNGRNVAGDIKKLLDGKEDVSPFCLAGVKQTRDAEAQRKLKIKTEQRESNAYPVDEMGRYIPKPNDKITCVLCPNSCEIDSNGNGGKCPRGADYYREEINESKRILTSSVIVWSDLISIRTSAPIPLSDFPEAMDRIRHLRFGPDCSASFRGEPLPPRPMVRPGDVLVKDFIKGIDLVATSTNVK